MSLFSSPKCVLIMSDDGLQIYLARSSGVKYLDSIPWETEDFSLAVSEIIVKKAKRQPIIILNDMVEQHYRKERIPNVSVLDKNNVLRRRLAIAFPNHKIRAALKYKYRTFEDKSRKGTPYLFAAIPNSTAYKLMMEAVEMSGAPVEGLYLLPLEASAVARSLSVKLSKKDRKKTIWTVFAGQHNNGGLRQIVTRDGELALTRMTPIVDTDIEPSLWAKEVSGELAATMSYLSRFGYKETDGLRIIVIANSAAAKSIAPIQNSEMDIMNASQAAKLLGVKLGRQADGRYADPLHVAYLSKVGKFQMPLKATAISRLSAPRKVAGLILLALFIGCAYFGYTAFQSLSQETILADKLAVASQKKEALEQEYNRELEIKKALGFDFALVSGSLQTFQQIESRKLKPLPLIREIGRSLGTDIYLDNMSMIVSQERKSGNAQDDQQEEVEQKSFVDIVLNLSFPGTISPDLGVQSINTLKNRLQENLPEVFNVSITRQVADLSYTGNYVENADEEAESEDFFAEITIRGPVQ